MRTFEATSKGLVANAVVVVLGAGQASTQTDATYQEMGTQTEAEFQEAPATVKFELLQDGLPYPEVL